MHKQDQNINKEKYIIKRSQKGHLGGFIPFSPISHVTDSKISHNNGGSNSDYQEEIAGAKILKEKKLLHLMKLRQQDGGSKAFYCSLHLYILLHLYNDGSRWFLTRDPKNLKVLER